MSCQCELPPGASLERTSAVLKKVEEIVAKTEGIESYQTIGGYGVVTNTYQSTTVHSSRGLNPGKNVTVKS